MASGLVDKVKDAVQGAGRKLASSPLVGGKGEGGAEGGAEGRAYYEEAAKKLRRDIEGIEEQGGGRRQ